MATGGGNFKDEVQSESDDCQELCRYFNTEGGCMFGDQCFYKHVKGKKPECWFYRSNGWCGFGDKCYFDHAPFEGKDCPAKESSSCCEDPCDEEAASVDEDDETSASDSIISSARDWIKSLRIKDEEDGSGNKKKENDDLKSDESVCDANNNEPAKREDIKAEQAEGGKEDSVKADTQKGRVKCVGECKTVFHGKSLTSAKKTLADHYQVKFSKTDRRHLRVFRENPEMFDLPYFCTLCDRVLSNIVGYLQHTTGKATSSKAEGKTHQERLDKLIALFVDRDVGTIKEEDMLEQLSDMLDTDESEWLTESDSDDSDCHLPYFARTLCRLMMNGPDDLEWEERSENFGFTGDEVDELLCQGIKPWDPEAYAALDVLYN